MWLGGSDVEKTVPAVGTVVDQVMVNLTAEQIERLRTRGEPVVIEFEGLGEVVVQDAGAYRRPLESIEVDEIAQSGAICRERLEEHRRDPSRALPIEEFFGRVRGHLGLAG